MVKHALTEKLPFHNKQVYGSDDIVLVVIDAKAAERCENVPWLQKDTAGRGKESYTAKFLIICVSIQKLKLLCLTQLSQTQIIQTQIKNSLTL